MFIKQRNHLCDRFLKLYLHQRVTHASVCMCVCVPTWACVTGQVHFLLICRIVSVNICLYVSMNMYASVISLISFLQLCSRILLSDHLCIDLQ